MCSVLLRSRACALSLKLSSRLTLRKSQSSLNGCQLQPRYASAWEANLFSQEALKEFDSYAQSPIIQLGIEPVEAAIIHFHSLTGNHWATDIVICSALVTLTSLPAAIMKERLIPRSWKTTMEVLETKKLHRIVYSPILKAEVLDMFKIGFWITCMFALRNISIGFPHHLAAETYQQMSTESLGWIPCLTSPDPYMIIPLAAGLISLTNIEFLKRYYYRNGIRSPYVVGLFRLSAVLLTEMMCYFPTNLSLYWLSFGILNLSKNVLIRQPSVKKLLKIPEIVAPTR